MIEVPPVLAVALVEFALVKRCQFHFHFGHVNPSPHVVILTSPSDERIGGSIHFLQLLSCEHGHTTKEGRVHSINTE